MSNAAPSSPAQLVKAALILYIGISLGALFFILISLVLNQSQGALYPELARQATWLKAGLAVICLVCLTVARKRYSQKLAIAKEPLKSLQDKLSGYIRALIIYLVFCEIPVIVSVIVFMLTGDFSFLAFGAVVLGFMLAILPVKKKIIQKLELSSSEQQELG